MNPDSRGSAIHQVFYRSSFLPTLLYTMLPLQDPNGVAADEKFIVGFTMVIAVNLPLVGSSSLNYASLKRADFTFFFKCLSNIRKLWHNFVWSAARPKNIRICRSTTDDRLDCNNDSIEPSSYFLSPRPHLLWIRSVGFLGSLRLFSDNFTGVSFEFQISDSDIKWQHKFWLSISEQ